MSEAKKYPEEPTRNLLKLPFHVLRNGVVEYEDSAWLHQGALEATNEEEKYVKLGRQVFMHSQYWCEKYKTCMTKAYQKRLNLRIERLNEKRVYITYNMHALYGMPTNTNNVIPAIMFWGLMREISYAIKLFHESYPDDVDYFRFQIHNSSRHRLDGVEFVGIKESHPFYKQATNLKYRIQADLGGSKPYLPAFLRHTRRLLNDIGPHSWFTFDERDFLDDEYESLYIQKKLKKIRAEREKANAAIKSN